MYEDIVITVKVHSTNKNHYQSKIDKYIKSGDEIKITQSQLPITSRVEVKCKCDLCEKDFYRVRKDVKENTLCSKKCRNDYLKSVNPSLNSIKHVVSCETCKNKFEVVDSKFKSQKFFLCSRECYKKHRSKYYNGDKLYNYQNEFVECNNSKCTSKVKTSDYYRENNNHQFCSHKCYWEFKSEYYNEYYYVPQLFEERKETVPESMVRKWLESNCIEYIQEYRIGKYYVDFYIPDTNLIIEVYGDYWHVNPAIYGYEEGKREIHKNQIGKWDKDKLRINDLKSKGYNVRTIWESDVHKNLEYCMNDIIN